MTHVVTKICVGCKDMSCASVCPVECFHVGPEMLYIDPQICIDCEQCVGECPVDAIFHDEDLPPQHADDLQINADRVLIHPLFQI